MNIANTLKAIFFNTFIPFFYPFLMLPLRYYRKKAIGMMSFKPGDRIRSCRQWIYLHWVTYYTYIGWIGLQKAGILLV